MDKGKSPDCLKCEYFYVTWDPAFPRGCRVFEIKSKQMPSYEVKKATGMHCPSYKESSKLKKKKSENSTDITV